MTKHKKILMFLLGGLLASAGAIQSAHAGCVGSWQSTWSGYSLCNDGPGGTGGDQAASQGVLSPKRVGVVCADNDCGSGCGGVSKTGYGEGRDATFPTIITCQGFTTGSTAYSGTCSSETDQHRARLADPIC